MEIFIQKINAADERVNGCIHIFIHVTSDLNVTRGPNGLRTTSLFNVCYLSI